ncbi:hypothetical protein C21_03197 [Arenibacter sp. NBRC 103722]|nr:hypothetical protein C21_03197 [Arenibacter sp. NBRC 103722]
MPVTLGVCYKPELMKMLHLIKKHHTSSLGYMIIASQINLKVKPKNG